MLLYIFSVILLFVLAILEPKTKEKINLIKTITLIFICMFAYNTATCYIFSMIGIPITLLSLSILNILISIILLYLIIKKKNLQTYQINKKDILATILILFITFIMVAINFRGITRIRYISMDSVQHYKAAREFSESESLLNKTTNTTTSASHMPMGYVNAGILFKIFRNFIGLIPLYKIYIIFEAFIYFLIGMMFYFCIQKILKDRNEWIIGIIFTIIYLIGYPLNGLISGFHYLLIGILYFTAIFYTIISIKKIKFSHQLILIFLLNIGLIFSYALFCPIAYLAELIYFIKNYKENKNKKELIIFILCTLIITGLMGCEFILFQRAKEIGESGIKLEGWIYQNNWSNFILFLPFTCYYILKTRKDKNLSLEKIIFSIFIIVYISLLIAKNMGICSNYYFYKMSYLLWLFLIYTNINGMILFMKQDKIKKYIINVCTFFYLFLLAFSLYFIDTPLILEGKNKESIANMMEVFTFNKTNMKIEIPFVYKEELELIEKLDNTLESNWQNESSILLIGNETQERWIEALTGYKFTIYPDIIEHIIKWNNGQYKYLLILQKREPYKIINKKINLEQAELIYQNEGGKLYIRNGE